MLPGRAPDWMHKAQPREYRIPRCALLGPRGGNSNILAAGGLLVTDQITGVVLPVSALCREIRRIIRHGNLVLQLGLVWRCDRVMIVS